jgi:hypothetical protein
MLPYVIRKLVGFMQLLLYAALHMESASSVVQGTFPHHSLDPPLIRPEPTRGSQILTESHVVGVVPLISVSHSYVVLATFLAPFSFHIVTNVCPRTNGLFLKHR